MVPKGSFSSLLSNPCFVHSTSWGLFEAMAYKHASVHTHDSLKRVMEASAHLVTPLKRSSKATLESFSCLRLEFGDNKRSARLILQMIK